MSQLIIREIEIIPLQIPLHEPFVISKGPLYHASNTFIKIYVDDIYGIGECCPFRTIHGETQAGTVAAAQDLANLLIGKDARQIHLLMGIIDKSLAGNASVKCAFDMALYDLNAKSVNLPLYAYLNGHLRDDIYTDMTVSLLEESKMVEKAKKFVADGFPVLKVKLGDRPSSKDVKRIQSIRNAIGMDIPLRIDANQGWNYLEAKRALNGMKEMNIEHCEAPIFAENIIDLRRLNQESPIPIMGDEAIFSHKDAFKNLAEQSVNLINIKLGKSGGICHAMKIASIAQAAGVYCQVGGFSETRVGMSALAHFCMVWDNIKYFDLDSCLMHAENPVIGGLTYTKNWQVSVPDTPGHGADMDIAFLRKWDKITVN